MDLFRGLIDEKTLRILRLFLGNAEELYHINKVSDITGVPLATTFRIIKSLLQHGLIRQTKVGKMKIYSLDNNKKTRKLRRIL